MAAGGGATVRDLGFPWPTRDPFLFCVFHDDKFPPGAANMGPDPKLLRGRPIGQDFGNPAWNMYHGETVPGFPRHPHRGFETVTVARAGHVDHFDSLGCSGRFGGGDVQWMTAGRGVCHCEMFPLLETAKDNPLNLFQIWLNLPSTNKMAQPAFKMIWRDTIPRLELEDGQGRKAHVAIVAGALRGGLEHNAPPTPPPDSWAADPANHVAVITIKLEPRATFTLPPAPDSEVLRSVYFFVGSTATVAGRMCSRHVCLEVNGDREVPIESTCDEVVELLVLQGRPIREPIAQHGPFVMNTRQEIIQAFSDYQRTEFGGWPHADDAPVHPRDQTRFARYNDGRTDLPTDLDKTAAPPTEAAASASAH